MLNPAEVVALGLLAERPWTAYELTRQTTGQDSYVGGLWPVSERTWYRLPKRLVETGLARAVVPSDGGPPRYEITAPGRAALSEARPTEFTLSFHSEPLALLYASGSGTLEQSLEILRYIRDDLRQLIERGRDNYVARSQHGAAMPNRAHVAALIGQYITLTAIHAYQWADDAIQHIETLETPDTDNREALAQQIWSDLVDQIDDFTRLRHVDTPPPKVRKAPPHPSNAQRVTRDGNTVATKRGG